MLKFMSKNNALTREDFLEMEAHCRELACGEHSPEDKKKFEKMAARYQAQANGKPSLISELCARFLYVLGSILYVVGVVTIQLANASWRQADSNRGKHTAVSVTIRPSVMEQNSFALE